MNEHFSYFFALTHIATSFPISEKHKNYKRQSESNGIETNIIFQNITILFEVPKSLNILFVTVEKTLNKVYLVAALEPHFTNPLLILDRFWKTTTRSTFLVSHSIAFFAKGTMTNFKPYWSWLLSEIHTFLQFYRLLASIVHKQPTFSNKNFWNRYLKIDVWFSILLY